MLGALFDLVLWPTRLFGISDWLAITIAVLAFLYM